jgi:hypothetical protein
MDLAKDCSWQRFRRELEGASLLGGLCTWLLWRLGLENGTGKLGTETMGITSSTIDCPPLDEAKCEVFAHGYKL